MKFLPWSKRPIKMFNIHFIYQFGFPQFFNEKMDMVHMDNKSCRNMISLPIIQFFERKL